MKIKLLSLILTLILLFGVIVVADEGFINYDNSKNPKLEVYNTITAMDLTVKEGKTITITDSSNQPILKIDQDLLLTDVIWKERGGGRKELSFLGAEQEGIS